MDSIYRRKEEIKEMEENLPPFILAITEGLASVDQALLQNPIEKFMQFVKQTWLISVEDVKSHLNSPPKDPNAQNDIVP